MTRRYLADHAWIDGAWARDVLLVAGSDGRWSRVEPNATDRAGAQVIEGAAIPALVNGHSHAFQRAIAGQTESAPAGQADDFWSWRDRMYQVALTITPQRLEQVATQLYRELRAGGYSHVCEFHYLHNDLDGRPYADAAEMSWALVRAAEAAGIGLTLLPTLYMRAGFGAAGLRDDQRRFASTPESVLRIAQAVRAHGGAGLPLTAGIAIHSIRAVDEGAMREVAQAAKAAGMPIHLHISEQVKEVEDCLRERGQRPIEWLLQRFDVDAGWNLVHATQAGEAELRALQKTGASIVLCPTTEANLGDGVFDLWNWGRLGGAWSIGSDSHVGRDWAEELRLLEYSQRLVRRERNVAARAAGREDTAAVLFDAALLGGDAAAGIATARLAVGRPADAIVLRDRAGLGPVDGAGLLQSALFSPGACAAGRL